MAGTKNNISFCVGKTTPMCLDLERVQTGSNDSLTVMQKAESLDGLKLISCTPKRECTLFRSSAIELGWGLLQRIMSSPFPSDLWKNSKLPVTTGVDEGTIYLITPDDIALELFPYERSQKVSWLEYIGEGEDFLSRRERLVIQLKERLVGHLRFLAKIRASNGEGDEGQDAYNADALVYVKPVQSLYEDDLPIVAKTSIDDIVLRFNDWLAQNADRLPPGCLERASFALSMKPLSGRWGKASGFYMLDQDTIAISPEVIGSFLDGDDKELLNTVAHECTHNDFADYGVRDEPAQIIIDAFALAEVEMNANKRSGRRIRKAAESLKSWWQDWDGIGNELNAYMSEPVTDHGAVYQRLNHIASNYPDEAAIYAYNWLEEFFISDTGMPAGKFAQAMVMTEKYKNYVKWRPLIASLDSMINGVMISQFKLDPQAEGAHIYLNPLNKIATSILTDRSLADKMFELPFNLFRRAQNFTIT